MILDKNGLYDIYGIWHQPFWQTMWFKYVYVSLISLALFLFGIFVGYKLFIKIRKKKYTAWERALMQLEQLKKKSFRTREDAKEAYSEITAILKTYLSDRYGWPVATATDDELAMYVQSSPMSEDLTQQIKVTLSGAVIIKFANQDALESQVINDIDRAIKIIQVTIPQPKK